MSKGSRDRTTDKRAYDAGYERVFGAPEKISEILPRVLTGGDVTGPHAFGWENPDDLRERIFDKAFQGMEKQQAQSLKDLVTEAQKTLGHYGEPVTFPKNEPPRMKLMISPYETKEMEVTLQIPTREVVPMHRKDKSIPPNDDPPYPRITPKHTLTDPYAPAPADVKELEQREQENYEV
jgi:hypothetical protein